MNRKRLQQVILGSAGAVVLAGGALLAAAEYQAGHQFAPHGGPAPYGCPRRKRRQQSPAHRRPPAYPDACTLGHAPSGPDRQGPGNHQVDPHAGPLDPQPQL